MSTSLARLIQIAQTQHGCCSWQQAMEVLGKSAFVRCVDAGIFQRIWPSVYALAGGVQSWEHQIAAVALSIPGSVASHRSAARLWGLTFASGDRIEITVPYGGAKVRKGVRIHRSLQLDNWVTQCRGIPVTTVARTLVDLSSCLSFGQLGAVLDQACNLKLVRLIEVEKCLDGMITIGRSRITMLRQHLEFRTETDERLDSFLERKALKMIRSAGLPEPKAQHWVTANGNRYRIDLAYLEHKIAIEPDGPHHLLPSVAAHDRRRDADLALSGWLVLHFLEEMETITFLSSLKKALSVRALPSEG